ncbi:polysaccharide pyruvyl transferase family protein [Akkermansia sp.]
MRAFQDCRCVITDSFHGTCFAIIFNKPFCASKTRKEEQSASRPC